MEHRFKLHAEWHGGRNGVGSLSSGGLNTDISIPAAMEGPGTGTNPDEMLLGAASTCYLITLAAMLERSSMTPTALTLHSEAVVDTTGGVFTYVSITHFPSIVLPGEASDHVADKVRRLADKAEQTCMISKAVRGNVKLAVEPDIQFQSREGGSQ